MTERQFQKADAAVERAVTAFMRKIEPMLGKWEAVPFTYIVERLLLALCTELSKLIDESKIAGPATLKLSIALADSGIRDRGTVKRSSVR
jgi:hypothetical protein